MAETGPSGSMVLRQILLVMVGILAGLPAFLIGGVHIQSQVLMLACVGIWLLMLLLRPAAKGHPKRYVFDGWFGWLLAACVWTALQLVPLPPEVLSWLSPRAHEIFSRVLGDIPGAWPSMRPLSVSPPETSMKLIRDIGVLLLFAGSVMWAHHRWHLRMLLRVMVIASMALSGLVLVQTLLRIEKPLMGLYTPAGGGGGLLLGSPLVNMNHLGGYLLFHSLLAFVLSLDAEDRRMRWFWVAGGTVMGGLIFLTLSRGAIVFYILGMLAFFALVGMDASRRRTDSRSEGEENGESEEPRLASSVWVEVWRRPSTRWAILLGSLVFLALADFASDALYKEFQHTSLSLREDKLGAIYEFSAPLIRDFPLVGVGRGAMGMAWHRVSSTEMISKGRVTATHVESALLQPLVDWGVLLGLLWLLWGGWLFWRTWCGARGVVERGAFLAVLLLFLQNWADFNLEFFATAFPCFLLLGALRRQYHDRKKERQGRSLRVVWGALVIGLGIAAVYIPSAWSDNYQRVHEQWAILEDRDADEFESGFMRLVSKRPSDYTVALLVARHYNQGKRWQPDKALRWLEKARYLNPTEGSIALLLAYTYARLGLYQDACIEMDRSVELSPHLASNAAFLVEQFGFFRQALQRLKHSHLLEIVVSKGIQKKEQKALFFDAKDALLSKFPKEFWLYRRILDLLAEKERQAQQKKPKKIESKGQEVQSTPYRESWEFLFRIRRIFPNQQGFFFFYKARILLAEQRPLDAIVAYEDALRYQSNPMYWTAFFDLMSLRISLRKEAEVRGMFARGRRQIKESYRLGQLFFLYSQMFLKRYAYREALEMLEQASQYDSKADGYRFALAEVYAHVGSFQRSLGMYRRYVLDPRYAAFAKKQMLWVEQLQRAARDTQGVSPREAKEFQE